MKTTAIKGVWMHNCTNGAVIVFDTNDNQATAMHNDAEIDHRHFDNGILLSDAEAYILRIEARVFTQTPAAVC